MDDDSALDEAIALLARRAHRRNRERAHRVAELLAPRGTMPGAAARAEAVELCHAVAGSAGTFGDADLTDAARQLETALRDGHDDDVPAALDRFCVVAHRPPPR